MNTRMKLGIASALRSLVSVTGGFGISATVISILAPKAFWGPHWWIWASVTVVSVIVYFLSWRWEMRFVASID